MNRRAFTATLASVLGLKLPAAADPVVKAVLLKPTAFDPVSYRGEFKWINTACAEAARDAWTGRFAVAYKDLVDKQ